MAMEYHGLEYITNEYYHPNISVISFDIFDTLLLRPFKESDKFHLLEKQFNQLSDAHISFAKLRTQSEAWLRRQINSGEIKKEDILIEDIYRVMHEKFHIEKTVADRMMEEEYQLETVFCFPRKTGKYLFEKAVETGKKIVLVTDMYFHHFQIEYLLKKNGFYGYDKLYVSSNEGLRKISGNLYCHILEDLHILPEEMLHIGDNQESDYKIPLSLRIKAFWLPSTREIYNQYGCSSQVTKICRDLTNWEIAKQEHGISIMRQMAANLYFDNPFREFIRESDYNGDPYFVGYSALGMEVLALVRWLKDNMNRDHVKKMIFLSRDGYLPMKVYEIFREYDRDLPEAEYVYTSRIALLPVMIKEKEDLFDMPVDISYQNPKKLLLLLDFCKKENGYEAMVKENPKHIYKEEVVFTKESFQAFISDFIKYGYDERKHEESKKSIRKYLLDTAGLEDDVAIFDMGYSGRIAGAITEATGKHMYIYYFHTDGNHIYDEERKHHFKVRSFLDFSPYMESTLREYAYLEPAPSCVGYGENGTLLFDQGPSEGYMETVSRFQQGAIDFVKDFMKCFAGYEKETAFRYHNAAMPFEAFLRHCSAADKKMFSMVNIDDELWGGRRDINLLNLMERRLEKMPEYATVYHENQSHKTPIKKAEIQKTQMKQKDILWEAAFNWYEFDHQGTALYIDAHRDNLIDLLCRRCKRVTVMVKDFERFQMLKKKYTKTENLLFVTRLDDILYDYIIGMDGIEYEENPVKQLQNWTAYLKPQGKLLLSCDNRYGLQYFCGSKEKHTGISYMGINGYYKDTPVIREKDIFKEKKGTSFSKLELEKLLQAAGCDSYKFYYPVPDDKMPQMIFTDGWIDGAHVMERLIDYHYSDENMQGMEHRILKDVIEGGALPFLSDSFIIEIAPQGNFSDIQYAVITTDRGKTYGMATTVRSGDIVYKRPLWKEGEEQLKKLYGYTEGLYNKKVPILKGILKEDAAGLYLEMPFVHGENLSCVLDYFVAEDKEQFLHIFDEIYAAIQKSYLQGAEGKGRVFLDLAPCNCFYLKDNPEGEKLLFYDQEFVTDNGSLEFAMFRTIKYYFAASKIAGNDMEIQYLYDRYGIRSDMIEDFEKKEQDFLNEIRHKNQYDWLFQIATPDYRKLYRNNVGITKKDSHKPYGIGYVPGVFDLFHTGHLKLIKRCKERCNYLIVGVLTDELVEFYKGKKPVISYEDRAYVISGLEDVDEVVAVDFTNTDKLAAWEQLHYDCHFSGDDHMGHWNDIWEELKKRGSNMEFLSYTKGISSTEIKEKMKEDTEG